MWAQIINALLGVFLMATPALFQLGGSASDNFHIFGPIITTFAIVSWWEATRSMRLWNVPPGVWLIVSPIFLSYESRTGIIVAVGTGIAVTALSFVRGKIEKRYGGGWKALWRRGALHEREALTRTPDNSDPNKQKWAELRQNGSNRPES